MGPDILEWGVFYESITNDLLDAVAILWTPERLETVRCSYRVLIRYVEPLISVLVGHSKGLKLISRFQQVLSSVIPPYT